MGSRLYNLPKCARAVAVTQQIDIDPVTGEHRDTLSHEWIKFLIACDCLPIPLPNQPDVATRIVHEVPVDGLLLTGGNDRAADGGDTPERDRTELTLLTEAIHDNVPVIGVGRSMQIIRRLFAAPVRAAGGTYRTVVAMENEEPLEAWETTANGVVNAIRHKSDPIVGIMWHPERLNPYCRKDIALFKQIFGPQR